MGPGAKKLGVGFFIDSQLSGDYGSNANDYRQAPFMPGTSTQGQQYAMTNGDMFRIGAQALDLEAQMRFEKGFLEVTDKQKDEVLKAFESNKSKFVFEGIKASDFFGQLRYITLAGVYADPIYGGNAGMEGWRMKSYPGAQMTYLAQIEGGDKFEVIPPISLADMAH